MSENPLITIVTIAATVMLIVYFEKRKRTQTDKARFVRNGEPQNEADDSTSRARPSSRRRAFPAAPGRDQAH
jgi:hypothetical protein